MILKYNEIISEISLDLLLTDIADNILISHILLLSICENLNINLREMAAIKEIFVSGSN